MLLRTRFGLACCAAWALTTAMACQATPSPAPTTTTTPPRRAATAKVTPVGARSPWPPREPLNRSDYEKRLFEAFTEKRDILHLLDHSLRGEGVKIFIGQESGYGILDDCSVVTAPYSSDKGVMGVIGVIGPTRMAYERIIPVVDLTAKLLGAALNSRR